ADLLGMPLFEQILRVHLGEPLAEWPAPPKRHAVAEPVIADRSGTLTAAPGPLDLDDGPVRLTYLPQRAVGDTITVTRTNRDYLGTVRAIGPGPEEVEAALTRFRADHEWTIA